MSVIHLRVNHCGIELVDDYNAPLKERVTGIAHDALLTLRQADDLIPMDDDDNLPLKVKLRAVQRILKHVIDGIDND